MEKAENLPTTDKLELQARIDRVRWYHGFQLAPGVVTPGKRKVDARAMLDGYGLPESLAGKRVLEIGAWDGPYSFELERRGAEVVATDIHDPDNTGFNTAKSILGSKVQYVRTGVYELEENAPGPFDMVLFLGVFYHLKHPLAAFEQIHAVLRDEGRVVFEGECFSHYCETVENRSPWSALVMTLAAHSNVPLTLCYPGRYKNSSNWFVPNIACLRSWLTASGFEVESIEATFQRYDPAVGKLRYFLQILRAQRWLRSLPDQRAWGVAVKRDQAPEVEHQLVAPKQPGT